MKFTILNAHDIIHPIGLAYIPDFYQNGTLLVRNVSIILLHSFPVVPIYTVRADQSTLTFQSFDLDRLSSLTQEPPMTRSFTVPTPSSTSQKVRKFIADFFIANDDRLSQSQAEAIAGRFSFNGESLYLLEKESFVKIYGEYGEILYKVLHNGKYSYVS